MEEIILTKREQRIFDYMMKYNSITSLEAFLDLGETRLSGCIFQLKSKGVNISSEMIEVQNRFGEKRHVKKYWVG